MAGITIKASIVVRTTRGARFPAASYAAALLPARASLIRDVERAFATRADPVSGVAWPARKHAYSHPLLVKSGAMKQGAIDAATAATITGSSLTAKQRTPVYVGYQARGTRLITARRFLGASIGTIGIVQRGLATVGANEAVRIMRGR